MQIKGLGIGMNFFAEDETQPREVKWPAQGWFIGTGGVPDARFCCGRGRDGDGSVFA